MICLGCLEGEHDACLNILGPDRCGCGCPQLAGPLVIIMPDPHRPTRQCNHEAPGPGLRRRCRQGHPLTGSNLYIDPSTCDRLCRTCRRAAWRRSKQRQRKEIACDN
jgi:hypothetical protein